MAIDQNNDKANDEPTEGGLAALKRLAALDSGGTAAPQQGASSQAEDVMESIPEWLELLLVKYGEQLSNLIGIELPPPGAVRPRDLADAPPSSQEASQVASLLEQMGTGPEASPPSGQVPTSVDWGEPAPRQDEAEGLATDWLDQIAGLPSSAPPGPAEEETPDWLSDISGFGPEADVAVERQEDAEPLEGEKGIPDWLQELPSPVQPSAIPQSEEPSLPDIPSSEHEVPDWLVDLGATPESKGPPEAEEPAFIAEDETPPDWLKDLAAPEAPPDQPAAPPDVVPDVSAGPEAEIPDWLRELGAAEEIPTTESVEPEAEGPDWLSSLEAVEEAPVAEAPPEQPPVVLGDAPETSVEPEAEVPDWLRKLGAVEEASVAEAPPEQPPAALEGVLEAPAEPESEVSDWPGALGEVEDVHVTESPPEQPPMAPEGAPEAPAEPEVAALDRLRELGATEEKLDFESPTVDTPAEVPAEPEEEVPDWLRELESAEETPGIEIPSVEQTLVAPDMAAEVPTESEEEVPDWLRELESVEETPDIESPVLEQPPPPVPEMGPEGQADMEAEVPDWLASLRAEQGPPLEEAIEEAAPPEHPPHEEAEEPDWLAALRTTDQPEPYALDEAVVEADQEEVPDWLAELRASQAAAEAPPAAPKEIEEAPVEIQIEAEGKPEEYPSTEVEIELPEVEEVEPSPIEVEYPTAEEEVVLDWLAEIESGVDVSDQVAEPPAEAEAPPVPESVPDWLRQMPPAEFAPEEEAPESEKATVETRRLPEWLAAGPDEEVDDVSPPAEETPEPEDVLLAEQGLASAEIPAWLQDLKPEEGEPEELPQEEPAESEDVLAGIPGLLPVADEEAEAEQEPIAALRSSIGMPEVPDVEGARLFKDIVAEPSVEAAAEEEKGKVEAEPAQESRRSRIVGTLTWALIFIILILAIAWALMAVLDRVGDLLGGPAFRESFGSPLVIDPAPVNTFRAQVTKLPPDAVVVVSFDYGPSTEAEMGLLAQIIVRDLLETQARVVAVSLRPEGAAMAHRLFMRFEDNYPYGQRTINLGYLSGQTAGVRSLAFLTSLPLFQNGAQILKDYPAWEDVDGLDDVALVIVLADSPTAVRWWVEQIGPGTASDRPMVAAVSTAADPTVRPYFNQIDPKSGQLLGLLSGMTDAAAYENRLGQPELAVESLAAQSIAHLGLVVLSLAGTVVGFRTHVAGE